MYIGEIIKRYRKEHDIPMSEFAKRSGLSKAYVGMLEKIYHPRNGNPISPSLSKVDAIARAMNITFDDLLLMLGDEQEVVINTEPLYKVTDKDERDIQKRLQSILDDLNSDAALSFYNGDQELDEETRELLKISLEQSIRTAKIKAKEKFTPNKYKK